ncbi:MAG: (Fe-S)-binding protein [Mailhella sp.]|nr:(Fe-S)-binding protein [Mailhella sp.]
MNAYSNHTLAAEYGAFSCVECGKCAAMCPMAETAGGFSRVKSPRGIVQQVLCGMPAGDMPGLLSCLQCRQCSQTCPAGIDVAGLIAALRRQLPAPPVRTCVLCGCELLPEDAERYLLSAVNGGFEERLAYPSLCPSCRRRHYAQNNS